LAQEGMFLILIWHIIQLEWQVHSFRLRLGAWITQQGSGLRMAMATTLLLTVNCRNVLGGCCLWLWSVCGLWKSSKIIWFQN